MMEMLKIQKIKHFFQIKNRISKKKRNSQGLNLLMVLKEGFVWISRNIINEPLSSVDGRKPLHTKLAS